MKGRLIAGLLALSLGLAGCGTTETAEATTITAVTTSATFEATTTAETTAKAAITETTPPQTTTVSETTAPIIYNDDEQTLKNLITEKTAKELLLWEYGDFDNDGTFEAFAFTGKFSDANGGSLWLVNSKGMQSIGNLVCDEIRSFSCDKNRFIYTYYRGAINRQEIWGVNGEDFYKAPISDAGIDLSVDENENITLLAVAVDNITFYDDNINGANTWKPYYFYYENGFHEYGGSEISLEELLEFENADTYVEEIKNLNGEITNILQRPNGIININYRIPDTEVDYLKWNYYYTLKIADEKVTHITDNPDKPEWDSGVYLPALLPEIATYSGVLYPVYQDGSYDYIDKTGKVIIDGNFNTAEFFSEGLGIVSKDGKYGAVNSNGDLVVTLEYLYLSDFHDGLAYASLDGISAGFINGHNEVKIPFKYSYLDWVENPVETKFSEGFAIVFTKEEQNNGHPVVIDTSGKELFSAPPVSGWGTFVYSDFHSGILYADYGYTNYMNERIFELTLKTIYEAPKVGVYPGIFSEGFAYVPTLKDKSLDYDEIREQGKDAWCYEYINTSGEIVFGKQFDKAGNFSEGLAVALKDGKTGVIDTSGEFVFYSDGLDPYWHKYSDGLLPFRKNENMKYGFIDRNGEIVLSTIYSDVVRNFDNGLALIELDSKLAYINKQGEIIYEFEKPAEES
jgi:hypothetical protein